MWDIAETKVHNVVLVGRSRAGKSTVRKTLIDPKSPSSQLNLYAETKDVDAVSLQVNQESYRQTSEKQILSSEYHSIVLNIVNTPGLFEVNKDVHLARNNTQLLMTISNGLARIGTSYHYICFCISIVDGIRKEDVDTLNNVLIYFGLDKLIEHICIIITRCEMKDLSQRAKLKAELEAQLPFVKLSKKGVLFAGCLNDADWQTGNATAIDFQFRNIMYYRQALLKLFTTPIKPFELKARETTVSLPSNPTPLYTSGAHGSSRGTSDKKLSSSSIAISNANDQGTTNHGAPQATYCRGCDREVNCKFHCPHESRDKCILN